MKTLCLICNLEHHHIGSHITKIHNITHKEYYNTYISKTSTPICENPKCDNENNLVSVLKGYTRYCCMSCARSDKWNEPNYREFQLELASKKMTDFNNKRWDKSNEEHEEFRNNNSERFKELRRSALDHNKSPEELSKFIEYESRGDKNRFLTTAKGFNNGFIYIAIFNDKLKVGITRSMNGDEHYLIARMADLVPNEFEHYLGEINKVAELEYQIKIKFNQIVNTKEYFSLDDLDSIRSFITTNIIL